MEKDQELEQMLGDVAQVSRVVLAELGESGIVPSPAMWARAKALTEACEWVSSVACGAMGFDPHYMQIAPAEAQRMTERLATRWATWLETGAMPEGEEL